MNDKNNIARNLDKVNDHLNKLYPEPEEKMETWKEIDKIVDSRFLMKALDILPEENREEFVELFTSSPDDEEKIFGYLEEKGGKDTREDLTNLLSDISQELVHDLVPPRDEITAELTVGEMKEPVK
jgi:hypothetical protein